ncbi:GTPase HflX [Poriferisphaera sp. WC338]|uniref:GTPase HflX n=1 Tax=Poriferisphaera sp. WC338 TaxID=3425129 RepID=UPI003D817324
MTQMQREELNVDQEPAILVGCILPNDLSDPNNPLGELASLASTAGAVVKDTLLQKRMKPDPATFIGKGKVEELAALVKAFEAKVVIFENDLSPSQIGNVEKVVECKVLDRSELILDIFAARAQTHEARLQVELAQLIYTYPRLRAMWSHLERIAGGAPAGIGTRGPGEQQLEIDRRIVQRKKTQLRRQIAELQARKTREVAARNKDHYTVGLVGYTNAGKSTFFNTATDGGAYADDKLFATLSTRTRKWNLGDGDTVMLSDTVGFVRNLPHHLVASFRATLEESIHSDLLLIVLDVSNPRAQHELDTVMHVLDEIGATEQPRALLLNKTDKLQNNAELLYFTQKFPEALPISALTGKGFAEVAEFIREKSHGRMREIPLTLNIADGKSIQYLETRTTVLEREYKDDTVTFTVRIGRNQLNQLRALGTSAILPDDLATGGSGWGR